MTPIAHFDAVWGRCEQLSALHAFLANNLSAVLRPDEILRAEWVARVSALDLYVHELVAQRMLAIFEGRFPKTAAYSAFRIPTETLDRIRSSTVPSDTSAAFDFEVRKQLGLLTFQDPEKIADGVRLCSNAELWLCVAEKLGATAQPKVAEAKAIKRTLAAIVQRRNKIAHEGDLQPGIPRTPWPISQPDLTTVSSFVEKIVRAIDACV